MRRTALLLAVAGALAACGGGQTQGAAFDPQWQSDTGVAIAALQERLASVPVPVGVDVAIGVGSNTIYGVAIDGSKSPPWSFTHTLETRPTIAGTVVVGVGGGELFALDARTGKPLWKRAGAGLLRGAGDDGKTTVVSLASTTSKGTTVLAISHDGNVLRQIEDTSSIGVPSVIDGFAFLPWQGQYVTVYDIAAGEEKGRALLRSQTSRVFASGGALFFGELAATRFDDRIRLGAANKASTISLPTRELPAAPSWMPTGLEPEPIRASASDKVRLYARPTPSGAPAIDSGRFAATYYRIALGFGAKGGELVWAHLHDADFLAGSAFAGGFALCDAKGTVTLFDARSGAVTARVSFGHEIDACVVQTDGLKQPARPRRARSRIKSPPAS